MEGKAPQQNGVETHTRMNAITETLHRRIIPARMQWVASVGGTGKMGAQKLTIQYTKCYNAHQRTRTRPTTETSPINDLNRTNRVCTEETWSDHTQRPLEIPALFTGRGLLINGPQNAIYCSPKMRLVEKLHNVL